jgi:hypothetical protein
MFGFGREAVQSDGRIIMGFDVSKLKDDPRTPDPDSYLVGRIPGMGRRVALDAAIPRSINLGAVAGRWSSDRALASRSVATLGSPLLRAVVGNPSSSTLGLDRPSEAFRCGTSTLGDNPLVKSIAQIDSLAAAESQASVSLNASMMRGVAGSFRNLDALRESTRSWQFNYDISFGKTAIEQVTELQRSFASPYTNSASGFALPFSTWSPDIGTRGVQGFVKPYELPWKATLESIVNAPLFNAFSKVAAGYAGWAQRIGDLFEVWRPKLVGVSEWLRREMEEWPQDPYGDPVPFWNVRLYRLAQAAYKGDYVARARFLDEIGANDAPDNVLIIGELLKPTFDPQRVDRRVDWEQLEPVEARRWLKRRLNGLKLGAWKEEQERKNGERRYEVERQVIKAGTSDVPELELIEFEIREDERVLYEQLRSVLPEQQYWFCWHRAQGLKYEEIAANMGIALSTVKAHARLLKRNPSFLEVVGR